MDMIVEIKHARMKANCKRNGLLLRFGIHQMELDKSLAAGWCSSHRQKLNSSLLAAMKGLLQKTRSGFLSAAASQRQSRAAGDRHCEAFTKNRQGKC
jgi:hypothetical protein